MPRVAKSREFLIHHYNGLIALYLALNQTDAALRTLGGCTRDVAAAHPRRAGGPRSQERAGRGFARRCAVLFRNTQPRRAQDALRVYQEAIALQTDALKQAPEVLKYRKFLSLHWGNVADVYLHLQEPAKSAEAVAQYQKLWPKDASKLYGAARDVSRCIAYVAKGKATLTPEEQAERDRYADQALASLRQAVAWGFQDAEKM